MKRTYGLIGYPLTHSFSEKYFNQKFEKEQIENCEYKLFSLEDINQFTLLIQKFPELKGLNITIPYKEKIIPFLNELDETAKAVGAVNCIKIDSQLTGCNTDVFGFRQSIKPFLESHHERALILGTGGASKAVAYVLKEIGIDCFFVSREKKQPKIFSYQELNENIFKAFKLIINTTPLGMFPDVNTAPGIPYQFINSSHFLYDLIYNPEETEFIKRAKQKEAKSINGLSMLHLQAERAWEIWNE